MIASVHLLQPVCIFQNSANQSPSSPQSLQFAGWTRQPIKQQIPWWILQDVEVQGQLRQMGGAGLQSWSHNFIVSLWESTFRESVIMQKKITLKQKTARDSLGFVHEEDYIKYETICKKGGTLFKSRKIHSLNS